MKFLLVICAIVLTAQCAPQFVPPNVNQVVPQFEISPNGEYTFGYETPDGQTRFEEGVLVTRPGEDGRPVPVIVVTGTYSYIGDDGVAVVNEYVADENGFQPKITRNGTPLVRPFSTIRPVIPTIRPVIPTIPTLPTLRPTFRPTFRPQFNVKK